ncbi:MAG TPA: hypothetical protein VIK14_03955 [Ignavibacteria bacterium]
MKIDSKLFVLSFLVLFIIYINGCNEEENKGNTKSTTQTQIKRETPKEKESPKEQENSKESEKKLGNITLKLVSMENPYARYSSEENPVTKIEFELTNKLSEHIDEYWLDANLKDKKGEYLAGNESVMFTNIRDGRTALEKAYWRNTNPSEVGEIVLKLYNFEVEGKKYKGGEDFTTILDNKYKIKVHF